MPPQHPDHNMQVMPGTAGVFPPPPLEPLPLGCGDTTSNMLLFTFSFTSPESFADTRTGNFVVAG